MRHVLSLLLAVSTAGLLAACSDAEKSAEATNHDDPMAALSARIDQAHQDIESLKEAAKATNAPDQERFASLTTDNKTAVILRTDFGPLLLKIKGVSGKGNDAKLQLAIGNPYAVSFNGASFRLTYGSFDAEGNIDSATQKTREVSLKKTIAPSATTVVTLDAKDISAKSLGYAIVDNLKFQSVGMR